MSQAAEGRLLIEKQRRAISAAPTLWRQVKKSWVWYLFILPNVLHFLFFTLFPIIFLFVLSFHSWDIVGARRFIGLRNFEELATDEVFWAALLNTALYGVMFIPLAAAFSLGVALLANRPSRSMVFFRGAYFLPVVTSITVAGILWKHLFGPGRDDPINYFLAFLGIPSQTWLLSSTLALPTVTGLGIWSILGYYMVLWLAGLQSIPNELYDAAKMDGANSWNSFRFVTLPLLRPTTILIVIIATIRSFQVFGEVYLLTGGGPVHGTMTIVFYVWQLAFTRYRMGYAALLSMVLLLMTLAVALVQKKFLGWEQEIY